MKTLLCVFSFVLAFSVHAFDLGKLEAQMEFKANLNHREGFETIALEITRSGFLKHKTEVQILYPGAGSHIAVLDLGRHLKLLNPSLLHFGFVITDISLDAKNATAKYIEALEQMGEIRELHQSRNSFLQGVEHGFTFVDVETNALFELIYAIDRTDSLVDVDDEIICGGRVFYYRQEYFEQADIIIHHDSSMDRTVSTFLSDFLISLGKSKNKDKVFVFEDMNSYYQLPSGEIWIDLSLLPGKKATYHNDFGCRRDDETCPVEEDHLGTPKYTGVTVYYPDSGFWGQFTSFEIKSYLLMSVLNYFPDTGPFNPDGTYVLLLNNIPELKIRIDSTLDVILDKLQNHSLYAPFSLAVEKFKNR